MTQPARRPSLLERAAEIYDFSSGTLIAPAPFVEPVPARAPEPDPIPELVAAPEPERAYEPAPVPEHVPAPEPQPSPEPAPAPRPLTKARRHAFLSGPAATVDRQRLRENGFLVPEDASGSLAEELRLVKRQLLAVAAGRTGIADAKRRSALVCSGQADEGKTFCALNLALSLAGEQEVEVLLVDGDFAKPAIFGLLGLEAGPGLVDALADPAIDAESLILRTDIKGLSVLSAGRQANNVPELLASERTRQVLDGLLEADPRRLIIFDSPPVLMASSAGALAAHVGQVLVVVRADVTTEADLKETVAQLSGNDHLGLVLNGAGFAAGGRRYGQYYGVEP